MPLPRQPLSLKARALGYLSRREHSRAELRRKLAQHAESAEEVDALLDWLERENWLSNARFAESVVHRRAGRYGTARLMQELKISLDHVMGHKEYPRNVTACPGRQWLEDKQWKNLLVEHIKAVQAGKAGPFEKALGHYVLFWQHPNNWAKQDWKGAINYIGRFRPTCGFSVDDAKYAEYVTIVGGTAGVSQEAEDALRAAGCKVERIAGKDFDETKRILDTLAESGKRFLSL